MKILIANKFFYRNGGSEVVMFQERDHLVGAGHQVIDFSMKHDRNLFSVNADSFIQKRDYKSNFRKIQALKDALLIIHSPEAKNKISELIKRTKPDLLHCHNIYHQLTPSIIGAAKKINIPVVLTLHDYKPVCPVYNRLRDGKPCSDCLEGGFSHVLRHRCAAGSFGQSALLYTEALLQRWMRNYEKVDAYIAPSRFMKEAISHRIPSERIHLLYNGVDTETLRGSGIDENYVLYLGRLSAEKGVKTLLAAHSASQGAWKLVIAGTGPLDNELRAQNRQATFLGHISGEALHAVMDKASVIVVPSEWYENCPMAVLEAMSYGKAVVGSRIGGIPELVIPGETGLLFNAGDAKELCLHLTRLMSDVQLRQAMGRRARARAELDFSLVNHNKGLLNIYQSLLAQCEH